MATNGPKGCDWPVKYLERSPLFLAGAGSILIALLHVVIILVGPDGYRYFGAGQLAPLAERGSLVPALLTAVIAAVFAVWGAYALSGARFLPRLPLLRTGLLAIGSIYTLRGLAIIPESVQLARGHLQAPRMAVFSAAALLLGLLYLIGTALCWRSLHSSDRGIVA